MSKMGPKNERPVYPPTVLDLEITQFFGYCQGALGRKPISHIHMATEIAQWLSSPPTTPSPCLWVPVDCFFFLIYFY